MYEKEFKYFWKILLDLHLSCGQKNLQVLYVNYIRYGPHICLELKRKIK